MMALVRAVGTCALLALAGCATPAASGGGASPEGPDTEGGEARPDPGARSCEAAVARGAALLERGEATRAATLLESVTRRREGCTDAVLHLAIAERRAERPRAALRAARRALTLEPGQVRAWHQIALAHLALAEDDVDQLARAALACRQGARVDPRHAPLLNTWGLVQAQRGHVVDALDKFERAFEADPQLFEAWMNFAQISLSFRGFADAERAFRAALELRPKSYDALIGLGVARRGRGAIDEAEALYERARAVDPSRPEAWFNLGVLHQEHKGSPADLRRAKRYFERFLAKARGDDRFAEEIRDVRRRRLRRIERALAGDGG